MGITASRSSGRRPGPGRGVRSNEPSATASPIARSTPAGHPVRAERRWMNGQITPAQFADLNAKVGGHDIDYKRPQPQRTRRADPRPAIERGVSVRGISTRPITCTSPIIDIRGSSNVENPRQASTAGRCRARLEARQRQTTTTRIIWDSFTAFFPPDSWSTRLSKAPGLFSSWIGGLSAIEAEYQRALLSPRKVVADKPSDAVDRCTLPGHGRIAGPRAFISAERVAAPRRGRRADPPNDTAKNASSKPSSATRLPAEAFHRCASGASCCRRFRPACGDYAQGRRIFSRRTVPWMTYRNGPRADNRWANPPASEPFCCAKKPMNP